MQSIDDYISLYLDVPHSKNMAQIDNFDTQLERLQVERPKELRDFKSHMQRLENFNKALGGLKFNLSLDGILAKMNDDIMQEQDDWLAKKEAAYQDIDMQVESLRSSIEQTNRNHNAALRQANASGNLGYETLESKRKMLESYSDKIFDICSQYGITTSDVEIDESLFTPESLNSLYDEYIKYMQKEQSSTNAISWLREKLPDTTMQGIILAGVLFLCYTPLLDIIALLFFGLLTYNQVKNVGKSKYYSILMAITFNIQPEKLGYVALDESQLLPEELTPEMLDTDERFAKFEQLYADVDSQLDEADPSSNIANVMQEWATKLPSNRDKLNEYKTIFENKLKAIQKDICLEIDFMKSEYERLKKEYKFLGKRFSKNYAFDYRMSLGLHDDCIEEYVDMEGKNVIIRPSIDTDTMNKFLQAMIVNAISNVCAGKLTVLVYDPNNFGRAIMPLFSKDVSKQIEFYNGDFNKLIDDQINYVQDNLKLMSGKSIDEFNAICQKTGKTPIDYRLVLILSQSEEMEKNEQLTSLFEYSNQGGVLLWVVSATMQSQNAHVFRRPFDGVQNPITAMITDEWCAETRENYVEAIKAAAPPALLWRSFVDRVWPDEKTWTGDATKFIDFYVGDEDGDPAKYKPYTLGNEGNVHAIAVGTSGAGKSVFLNHLISMLCRKYDPKVFELWLADFKGTEFQAYMKTPRPKAARLCMPMKAPEDYICMKTEKLAECLGYYSYNKETKEYSYSAEPTADCKEKYVFVQDVKNGKIKEKNGAPIPPRPKVDTAIPENMESYALPHVSACLCTSDGDYATSLFKAFRDLGDKRYADMGILGVKNLPGWNTRVQGLIGTRKPDRIIELHGKETGFNPIWSEADLWTRVLFICDEFQVIFQKAGPDNVAKIIADITQIAKVARACGMHVFFTSQSMKGTISDDILANFTLRFALRCEPEVSQAIIGSTRAAEIREKNGYLIVKSQEMKTAEDQKKYKTPFLCDDENSGTYTSSEMFDNVRYLYNLGVERGYKDRDVITYDEKTRHYIEELEAVYEDEVIQSKLPNSGVFFLGNRMAYSVNKAPDNIILTAKNNTHIMSCFSDYSDYVFFFNELMFNIQHNKVPGTVIINSQVADLAYITDAESYVTKDVHKKLLSEKNSPKEIIDWMYQLYNRRKETNNKETPVWIFLLGWEKGPGFAVDMDVSLRSRMNNLLAVCGEFNIHIIFIMTSMTGISASTVGACAYTIAGKCSLEDSQSLIGTKQASVYYEAIPTGWIFSKHDGLITRDKLYRSPIKHELQESSIVV